MPVYRLQGTGNKFLLLSQFVGSLPMVIRTVEPLW